MLQNRVFWLWRRDPVSELQFLAPLCEKACVCVYKLLCDCVKPSLCQSFSASKFAACKGFCVCAKASEDLQFLARKEKLPLLP